MVANGTVRNSFIINAGESILEREINGKWIEQKLYRVRISNYVASTDVNMGKVFKQ